MSSETAKSGFAAPGRGMTGKRQDGMALIALVAVIALGASWWVVSALSTPVNRLALEREHNAKVLAEAKAALIGWVAMTASTDASPGRLPCPETPAQIGTAQEGIAAPTAGFPNCSAAPGTVVGRLPWKTLGIEQLRDAAGEPLWYVVTTGTSWALQNSAAMTTINSNTTGQLNVDGVANAAVALIIAPGRPIAVTASANCAARNQARVTPAPGINVRDYLECQNAAGAVFVTSGALGSFNDQVLAVTTDDVLPVIEAVVADRFARNVAPLLRSAYSNSDGTNANWPAAPRLPFAAAFPSPLSYKGVAARTQGMLPFTYGTNGAGGSCNPADARCDPTFVAWRTGGPAPSITASSLVAGSQSCNATATTITCSFRSTFFVLSPATTQYTITHTANNVGLSLRTFNTAVALGNTQPGWVPAGTALAANGSATITVTGTTVDAAGVPGGLIGGLLEGLLCGLGGLLGLLLDCANHSVTVPIGILVDHPLILDNAANPQRWFVRNGWHEVAYYALAPTMAPGAAGGCTSNVDCLRVTYHANDFRQRGLIAIAGRSLNGQPRPPTTAADLLEGLNADVDATTFALRSPPLVINRQFNDRIGVIDLSP